MTQEELTVQLAAAFKARMRKRRHTPLEHGPGYSGALPVPSLPPEIVDEMGAAINKACEQVNAPRD